MIAKCIARSSDSTYGQFHLPLTDADKEVFKELEKNCVQCSKIGFLNAYKYGSNAYGIEIWEYELWMGKIEAKQGNRLTALKHYCDAAFLLNTMPKVSRPKVQRNDHFSRFNMLTILYKIASTVLKALVSSHYDLIRIQTHEALINIINNIYLFTRNSDLGKQKRLAEHIAENCFPHCLVQLPQLTHDANVIKQTEVLIRSLVLQSLIMLLSILKIFPGHYKAAYRLCWFVQTDSKLADTELDKDLVLRGVKDNVTKQTIVLGLFEGYNENEVFPNFVNLTQSDCDVIQRYGTLQSCAKKSLLLLLKTLKSEPIELDRIQKFLLHQNNTTVRCLNEKDRLSLCRIVYEKISRAYYEHWAEMERSAEIKENERVKKLTHLLGRMHNHYVTGKRKLEIEDSRLTSCMMNVYHQLTHMQANYVEEVLEYCRRGQTVLNHL